MTKFVQLQRMHADNATSSTVIFDLRDVLQINQTVAQNKFTGQMETFSQVILQGYPEIFFLTKVNLQTFESNMHIVDLTGGAGTGSSCTVPGVLDIVTADAIYPFVKFNRINNNVVIEDDPYIGNINYLYMVEEVPYVDKGTSEGKIAIALTFRGQPLRKIQTDTTLADIQAILDPVILV
jgi:hypothetical protein